MKIGKIFLIFTLCIFGCDTNEVKQMQEYNGPMYELTDVETLYSEGEDNLDSLAFVKFKLMADRQLIFDNEDMEFPEGIYIENYKIDGTVAFTLKANKGFFDSEEQVYKAEGNVILRNLLEEQQVNSEELFWKPGPGDDAIYTDKFVIVKTKDEIIYGEGLRASQNFETFKILKPSEGSFVIEE